MITEISGVATLKDTKKKREIIVTNSETGESKTYLIPYGSRIKVQDGVYLDAGDESFGFQWIVFRFEVHYYFSDIFPSGNTQNV